MATSQTESQRNPALELGKAYWRETLNLQSPDMSKEERTADWKENNRTYLKLGRAILKRLANKGLVVVPNS